MDLWQLKIFCKVVELKGFSKAAEAVYLSQPTVSSHIKDLETYFDCPLIDRVDKKAVPTKAGEILYTYACRLLTLRDEAETALAEHRGKISGRLTIGGSTIPGGYILPRIIGRFRESYPEVMVSLIIADTAKIISDVSTGLVELGIVGAKTKDKKLIQEPFIDDCMKLIVPAEHKWSQKSHIAPAQFLKEPFIIRERGSGTLKSILESLTRQKIDSHQLNIVAELGSTAAVIQGIKSRVGISILSPIAVAEDLKAGTVSALEISGVNLKRSFYLTRHKERSPSPLCKTFMAFINELDLPAP